MPEDGRLDRGSRRGSSPRVVAGQVQNRYLDTRNAKVSRAALARGLQLARLTWTPPF